MMLATAYVMVKERLGTSEPRVFWIAPIDATLHLAPATHPSTSGVEKRNIRWAMKTLITILRNVSSNPIPTIAMPVS